ncbi:hypothetical protein L3X38_029751 [Prunus dulcis]|uniref:Uncharacterized protein n=1 Tax=Prunus dulcis TaxID=3755 RepID=A0AAD4Z3A5_PRUDU|nr:hypothetical protein L3X38_029751 [Prunus dulcis]
MEDDASHHNAFEDLLIKHTGRTSNNQPPSLKDAKTPFDIFPKESRVHRREVRKREASEIIVVFSNSWTSFHQLNIVLLGTGMVTQDTSSSVLLFFDKQRFIFNVVERWSFVALDRAVWLVLSVLLSKGARSEKRLALNPRQHRQNIEDDTWAHLRDGASGATVAEKAVSNPSSDLAIFSLLPMLNLRLLTPKVLRLGSVMCNSWLHGVG